MRKLKKTKDWIKQVREGCKKTIKTDLEKIMKELDKGDWDRMNFAKLLQEIRDNERDDSLLVLIQEMIKEDEKENG